MNNLHCRVCELLFYTCMKRSNLILLEKVLHATSNYNALSIYICSQYFQRKQIVTYCGEVCKYSRNARLMQFTLCTVNTVCVAVKSVPNCFSMVRSTLNERNNPLFFFSRDDSSLQANVARSSSPVHG